MACCPQRTVQNIDKYKQKNAEIRRYNTVSGRVTSQCCATPCIPPTAGLIRTNNLGPTGDPTYDTLYSYTVDQTNGTSFVWFYIVGETTLQLSDGGNISGSQTQILLVKTRTTNCPPVSETPYFVCNVLNNCGSAGSQPIVVLGCGF
jgi:hypothetical protein